MLPIFTILNLLACTAGPTSGPAETAPAGPAEAAPAQPGGSAGAVLAPPTSVAPAADPEVEAFLQRHTPAPPRPLDHDPASARYLDAMVTKLRLTPAERAQLARDGLVVTRPTTGYSYAELYRGVFGRDLPVLITIDSVWFAYQQGYSTALRQLESDALHPRLMAVVGRLRDAIPTAPAGTRADLDVLLTVAAALGADPPGYGEQALPVVAADPANQAEVDRVFALARAEVDVVGTLFGRERSLALSRLRPQGLYVEGGQEWWRVVAWLQTARFVLVEDDVANAQETSDALALAGLVQSTGASVELGVIEDFLDAVLGQREGIAPDDVNTWLGSNAAGAPEESALGLKRAFPDRSRVRSVQSLEAAPSDRPRSPAFTFSLLPARSTLDGEVLSAVTNDAVRYHDAAVDRPVPSPLDVLFALGNDGVTEWLAPEVRAHPYHTQLEAQRARVDGAGESTWTGDIHHRWLGVIRSLNQSDSRRPPVFDSALGRRRLAQTQLVAWTWLRHDHALFAEEASPEGGCSYPDVYVDPYPGAWRQLADLAEASAALFAQVSPPPAPSGYAPGGEQIRALLAISREARGLADAAESLLATGHVPAATGRHLKDFIVKEQEYGAPDYSGWYASLFAPHAYLDDPRATTRVFRGASVGGAPDSMYVAAAGTEMLVVTIQTGHGPTAFAGPVQSFRSYVGDAPPVEPEADWDSKKGWIPRGPSPWTEPPWLAPLRAEPEGDAWKLPSRDKFTVDFPHR